MRTLPRTVAAALVVFLCPTTTEAGLVTTGDVSLLGFRSDNPDGFAFVLWKSVGAATTLSFFDSGYIGGGDGTGSGPGGGTWRATEGFLQWTAGSALPAGTVVVVSNNVADVGLTVGSLTGLSAGGDQIFVGEGITFDPGGNPSMLSGTLLFGLDFNGAAGWDAAATSTATSALPGDLFAHSISFAHTDNGQYAGPRSGFSVGQFRAMVADPAKWSFNNNGGAFGDIDSTDFSVASTVPEPGTLVILLSGLPGLVLRRRARRPSSF